MKNHILIFLLSFLSCSVFAQNLIDKIPINLIDRLIFIEIKLNDSEPLNFMFDTGAGITVIDTETASKLNLSTSKEVKIGTAGKTLKSKISENNEIFVGKNLKLDSLELALIDLSHLSKYFKTKVDGIIGVDLLNQAVIETNIDSMEFLLFSQENYKYNGIAEPLELIGLESNHLGLPIEITPKGSKESISLIIKIDTAAANYLTFHNHTVIEYGLIDNKIKYKKKRGFGADSTITNNLAGKLSTAIFAGQIWKNIPVVFEVDKLNSSSDRKANGLIGQSMLLDFNITYDLISGNIYLENRK
jgi:predicted aspartyl protease